MAQEEKKDQNGQAQEPTAEQENKRNWKQVAANWGKRFVWAGIGAGITIGITALKNRKKNRQQQQ